MSEGRRQTHVKATSDVLGRAAVHPTVVVQGLHNDVRAVQCPRQHIYRVVLLINLIQAGLAGRRKGSDIPLLVGQPPGDAGQGADEQQKHDLILYSTPVITSSIVRMDSLPAWWLGCGSTMSQLACGKHKHKKNWIAERIAHDDGHECAAGVGYCFIYYLEELYTDNRQFLSTF